VKGLLLPSNISKIVHYSFNLEWSPRRSLCKSIHYIINSYYSLEQCFSTDGSQPIFGSQALTLLLGRQNLCFSTMNVINGSPNCVLFCFMGYQLPNVENHCIRMLNEVKPALGLTNKGPTT
jgi:hypothetical protein